MQGQKTKQKLVMRKMCPNFDREDFLETVLDVPIPEEMFSGLGYSLALRWSRSIDSTNVPLNILPLSVLLILILLLLLLIVWRFSFFLEASTAKYIVQQYIAATGGQPPLNALNSMCVIGQTKTNSSEFHQSDENVKVRSKDEAGGFVIWQKNPDF
ncbi:UNVERIFIED_CONTAM: hypothetical protein Sradi_3116800 [Sesamum radiatum]|uniref:Uncharacterized protein n=1 Tax=Sesamum radiatum TaxID=300843 RepID=A0AAW2RE86_SESRA